MKRKRIIGIILALLAAVLYSISTPTSKILLNNVGPVLMASFLYLGAGLGIAMIYIFRFKKETPQDRLAKEDTPYVLGMITLDVIAPILMMLGIYMGSSSGSSLLGNFEIVATSLIALMIFKEIINRKLWLGIAFITSASILLSFDFKEGLSFSLGSLSVLLATLCWGFENNCTRKISGKSSYQIVIIKGLCSGAVSLVISLLIGEKMPELKYIALVMLLGFVAYGLSIFAYVKAQKILGAAKTSAFYAVAPFVGSLLAFVIVGESIGWTYLVSLGLMLIGASLVIVDTLKSEQTLSK